MSDKTICGVHKCEMLHTVTKEGDDLCLCFDCLQENIDELLDFQLKMKQKKEGE